MTEWRESVLGLGGNLGDRAKLLDSALAALDEHPEIRLKRVSSRYESFAATPTGVDETRPKYLNLVALIETSLKPKRLLECLHEIESQHGRLRLERWGSRTLDIDIIDYDARLEQGKKLTLPHPEAHARAFVLVPWAEIAPEATLPGHGKVKELAARLEGQVWLQS